MTLSNEWGNSTTELDFEKHWSAISIQQEVLRGIEVREQKPKSNEIECDFVDIFLPSCSRRHPGGPSTRKHKTRKVIKKTPLKRMSKDRVCPLRVVELAEPTKRHCLNTWKNNYQTLPDYMVDRLRRHVLDKSPVVRISEAVNFFKNRKSLPKKRSIVISNSQSTPRSKNTRQDFNMILCSLFAYKIAQKLTAPVNIILNEELDNINNVVTDEIKKILRKKKIGSVADKSDKILNEMAKKVTIWISNILEESSYKQLLEQLEELEEEEGPALDTIDDLLERVMGICEVDLFSSSHSTSSAENFSDDIYETLSTKNTEDGNESVFVNSSEKIDNLQEFDNNMQLDKDQIQSENDEQNYYNDNILGIDQTEGLKEQIKSLLEDKINDIIINIENINGIGSGATTHSFIAPDSRNNDTYFNQATDSKSNLQTSTGHEYINAQLVDHTIMSEPDNSGTAPAQNSPEHNSELHNDADVDGINKLTLEDLDEENKKVKFSNIDMDNSDKGTSINKYSSEFTDAYKEPVAFKSSKDYILSHFNVAPPNTTLLSFIDEVWPEYILPPLLKATESVNKSVTSLGKIMETDDENTIQSPSKKNAMQNNKKVFKKQLNAAMINLTDEGVSVQDIKNEGVDKTNDDREEFVKYKQREDQPSLEQLSIHFTTDDVGKTKIYKNEDLQILKTIVSNVEMAKDRQPKDGHYSAFRDVQVPDNIPPQDTINLSGKKTLQELGGIKSIKSKEQDVSNIKSNASAPDVRNIQSNKSVPDIKTIKSKVSGPVSDNIKTNVTVPNVTVQNVKTNKSIQHIKSTNSKGSVSDVMNIKTNIMAPEVHNIKSNILPNIQNLKSNILVPKVQDKKSNVLVSQVQNIKSNALLPEVKNIKTNVPVEDIPLNILAQLKLTHGWPANEYAKNIIGTSNSTVNNNFMTLNKKIQAGFRRHPNNDDLRFESNENLRKWCMGLQNVTENLELWAGWIQNVCLNITYLKHEGKALETDAFHNRHLKKWIKLKRNLDIDFQQWCQLRTRLSRGLQTYKTSYVMTQKATSIQEKNRCKCNHGSQNNPLCMKITTDRSTRRV